MGSLRLGLDPWGEEIFLRNMVEGPTTSFSRRRRIHKCFLIGTDRSVKLALAPFCFALVIKENSGMCSLQLHKYTEPTALIFIIAEKYQKNMFHKVCSSFTFSAVGVHLHILPNISQFRSSPN